MQEKRGGNAPFFMPRAVLPVASGVAGGSLE